MTRIRIQIVTVSDDGARKVLYHFCFPFLDGIGNFTYYMDMYEDETNNEIVTEFPKAVGLGQRMYFGFRVESGDSELVVFPDVCKATASSSFDDT